MGNRQEGVVVGLMMLILSNQYRILRCDDWVSTMIGILSAIIIILSVTVGRTMDNMKEEKDILDREVEEIMKKREF